MTERKKAMRIATLAIAIALVCVFTMAIRVPIGTGYLNLCDVAIVFCAYTFGPIPAMLAGALGPAIADLGGGFAQWAAISFVVHGLEGLIVGLILKTGRQSTASKLLAGLLCIIIVAGGYYVLSALFLLGFEAALADVIGNLLQSSAGAIFGSVLSQAVKKAYPPVESLAW